MSELTSSSSACLHSATVVRDQLRDHLALAATCRYFRTCYTNGQCARVLDFSCALLELTPLFVPATVVFQVLFQKKYPNFIVPADCITIQDDGAPWSSYASTTASYTFEYYGRPKTQLFGPVLRSWNHARWIFSTSEAAQGGWGVPTAEWEGSDAQQAEEQQMTELKDFLGEARDLQRPVIEKRLEERQKILYADWKVQVEQFRRDEETRNLATRAAGEMLVWNM